MRQKMISLLLNEKGKFISGRTTLKFYKKTGIYDYVKDMFDDTYSINEKIYCVIYELSSRKKCKTCGKELKFSWGYPNFCSRHCANIDPEVLEKNRKGVTRGLKLAYKNRGDEIKEKRANTLFKTYGIKTCSPFKVPQIQKEIKDYILETYGVTNVFCLEETQRKAKEAFRKKSIDTNKLLGYEVEYLGRNRMLIKNLCKIHGDIEMSNIDFYNRTRRERNGIVCPKCCPIYSFSSLELQFEEMLKEMNITTYEKRTKKYITPYELDFYFPEYKLAVELNGVYWHSEANVTSDQHKHKLELCNEKGIQLIYIWEDDFYYKREIVKSMLLNKFNKTETKIYARNCQIQNITSQQYKIFLEENHLQGQINSSLRYALIFNDEIVSIMGFGKLRIALGSKNADKVFEMQRFCNKLNTNVIGGASKLLNHFIKNADCEKIISYAKRDYSNGGLYEKLGFKLDKICEPGFYWLIKGKREHRFKYRKDKISNETNKNLTSIEIMHNLGHVRCYDTGNLKFVKEIVK